MQAVFKIENLIPSSFFGRGLPFKVDGTIKSWPDSQGLNLYSPIGTKFYLPIGLKMNGVIYQLPWEPSISLSFQKTIIKTGLAGNTRRGTVKELITTEDYNLSIQGICYDETRTSYPFEQVDKIRELVEYEGSLEIISALTSLLGIKNVVVDSWSIPGEKAKPYSQPFTIDLTSDEDFILIQT